MLQFYIEVDKQGYFAGDMVNGNVYLTNNSFLPHATGISLNFNGYECVKWVEKVQVQTHKRVQVGNRHKRKRIIPESKIFNTIKPIQVSDVESQHNKNYDHRPPYVRYNKQVFRMSYFQTRNGFTKNSILIYHCQGLSPGQYVFPFSFKTFEGWPASFEHSQLLKKGKIIYHLTVQIEPQNPKFQFKYSRQITLRQIRPITSQSKQNRGTIEHCCCCDQGSCGMRFHLEKDGFTPGQIIQIMVQIDNSQCKAQISTIHISVDNIVTMRSGERSTTSNIIVFGKNVNGIPAKSSAMIKQQFQLESKREIKPTCSGKLLSSEYHINVRLSHDVGCCSCCQTGVGFGIPIIIFPFIPVYPMPQVFQNNWEPQMMPQTNLQLSNDFANFNLQNMPPPMIPLPPENYDSVSEDEDCPPGKSWQPSGRVLQPHANNLSIMQKIVQYQPPRSLQMHEISMNLNNENQNMPHQQGNPNLNIMNGNGQNSPTHPNFGNQPNHPNNNPHNQMMMHGEEAMMNGHNSMGAQNSMMNAQNPIMMGNQFGRMSNQPQKAKLTKNVLQGHQNSVIESDGEQHFDEEAQY